MLIGVLTLHAARILKKTASRQSIVHQHALYTSFNLSNMYRNLLLLNIKRMRAEIKILHGDVSFGDNQWPDRPRPVRQRPDHDRS